MTTINRLSATDALEAGDGLVVYKPSQGDARRASLTTLVEYLKSAFSTFTASSYISVPGVAVANLPSASSAGSGARAMVTDASATTFASIVSGGGANAVPVYSDGTDWRIG